MTCNDKGKNKIQKDDILSYSLDSVPHKGSWTEGLVPTLVYLGLEKGCFTGLLTLKGILDLIPFSLLLAT